MLSNFFKSSQNIGLSSVLATVGYNGIILWMFPGDWVFLLGSVSQCLWTSMRRSNLCKKSVPNMTFSTSAKPKKWVNPCLNIYKDICAPLSTRKHIPVVQSQTNSKQQTSPTPAHQVTSSCELGLLLSLTGINRGVYSNYPYPQISCMSNTLGLSY